MLRLTRTIATDSSGQFTFARLPAGTFKLSVSSNQNQFFQTNYGARRAGGQGKFIPLADGQTLSLKVPLSRGAAITGLVTGPDGTPLRHVKAARRIVFLSSRTLPGQS